MDTFAHNSAINGKPMNKEVNMITFFRKLFCLHLFWIPEMQERVGLRYYVCSRCGKRKEFSVFNPPVNFIDS